MGRAIAIMNLKGGIGKTTTVVNVGAGLALKGARVLLVDTDAQGNLAMALGVQPRRTLYSTLVDGVPAAECVTSARTNLDLIGADHTLLGAMPVIAQRPDWSRALERALRPILPSYDFVLVDCGGSLSQFNINALVFASDVIAPTTIEPFSIKSIELLLSQLTQVKGPSAGVRAIIPTMYDPRMRQSVDLLAELRARYGQRVAPPIRVNVRLSESTSHGKTIYEYDPRSRGAFDYAMLVEHLSTLFGFVRAPTPPVTNGAAVPAATAAQPAASVTTTPPVAAANACPNCGHTLKYALLAGYRVAYCENCRYRSQTLANSPRR